MYVATPELRKHLGECWREQQRKLPQLDEVARRRRRQGVVQSNHELVRDMGFCIEEEHVTIAEEFASSNEISVLLATGLQGKVVRYEESGEVLVEFQGIPDLQRISKSDFARTKFEKKQIHHMLPELPPIESYCCSEEVVPLLTPRFAVTEICVANIDTVTAALEVGDAAALSFANEALPGGGYLHGARAQEEELCRQVPQLHAHLKTYSYPIPPGTALLSRGLAVVRRSTTYELCSSLGELNVITAAMPEGDPRPRTPQWDETVNLRIRSVLTAAKQSGYPNLVLGAFGCGAFGNPPEEVARIFKEQLSSPEFRGAFAKIVFAIIDPHGDGNLLPFERALASLN